jgi:hypothetical protein
VRAAMKIHVLASTVLLVPLAACAGSSPSQGTLNSHHAPASSSDPAHVGTNVASAPAIRHDALERADVNRLAVRQNLPLYWAADKNGNKTMDPEETKSLLFYPTEGKWVDAKGQSFTRAFEDVYARLKAADEAPKGLSPSETARRALVAEDLDQGKATLVFNDLTGLSAENKAFVRHILAASKLVDVLYATQKGILPLAKDVPQDDIPSQSLFRRNWGPKCAAPRTEKDPACSAIPAAPKLISDLYPGEIQKDPKFCDALEKNPNTKKLMEPFVVVRDKAGALEQVPYTEAYKTTMTAIANELRAAAAGLADPKEATLKAYVAAAAQAFTDNQWTPADEAWSKMNATNSRFYLRIGPDETYWEPCAQKAGFHVTFARINSDSLKWQEKLAPVQQEMENTLATQIGAPYKSRKVTFHLPDFIDIVWNAGDDRTPMGATIGQSLPNWGPVAAEGRGRTVAMSNLYTDPDSLKIRRAQAESLMTRESMGPYGDSAEPGLLATILHEATHNLGPAHEYKVNGKTDAQAFGGGLSSMMEELKAQTGGLYFIELTRKKGIITDDLAKQTYVDSIVWAFGHVSRGMYSPTGERKAYSQLAAIQLGFLMDEGALAFDPEAMAANGTDKGAFVIKFDKLVPAVDKLMKVVGGLKARGDKAGAEALAKKYVDSAKVPQKQITERVLRFPKPSFVYGIDI